MSGGGGVPCAVLHLSSLGMEMEVAFWSNDCGRWKYQRSEVSSRKSGRFRTSAGVGEEGFVNNQGETVREDVREGCDRCVGSTVCFASPNSNGHHTTSDITSRIGSETNGSETPDDRGIAKADNYRKERGGDVEIGVIDAGPDDHAKDESLT